MATQHKPYQRHWRFRTVTFGLFTGLAVYLLENLLDPFLPKNDADNTQLWSNTGVALAAGVIALVVLAYIVTGAIRRGLWERDEDARYKVHIGPMTHYVFVFLLALVCFVPLVLLTS